MHKSIKVFFPIFCLLVVAFQLFQILYFERSFFLDPYDASYCNDSFEHSQWVLPLSSRIIGDDGLFSYMGYDLIHGGSIAGFDAEVPPFGKYLIGLFIVIFNSPSYYALFFGVGSIVLFFFLAITVLKSKTLASFTTALFLQDPLFVNQFWRGWLDVSHLFFLLANILSLLKDKTIFSFLSGASLGFFATIKFPILLPLIFSLETFFILNKRNKIRRYFVFISGLVGAVLVSYIRFFVEGNSVLDFFRLQKYVIDFYLKSELIVHKDAIWQTLFLGNFPDVSGRFLIRVDEWWIVWPIVGAAGLIVSVVYLFRKNKGLFLKGLAIFILASITIYSLIPSYPRYLLVILPFLYLFAATVLKKFLRFRLLLIFLMAVLIYGVYHTFFFLQPNPLPIFHNMNATAFLVAHLSSQVCQCREHPRLSMRRNDMLRLYKVYQIP